MSFSDSRDTNDTFCSEKPSVTIILRYIDKMTGLNTFGRSSHGDRPVIARHRGHITCARGMQVWL